MASRVVRVDGPHGLQGPQVTVIARPQLGCKPSMSLAVGSAPARLFDFTSGQFNKEQRLPGVSCGKLVASRQRCENTKATQSTLEWTVDWEKWSNNMVLRGDSGKGRTVKSPKAGPCKDSWFAFVFLLPGPCEASTSLCGFSGGEDARRAGLRSVAVAPLARARRLPHGAKGSDLSGRAGGE